MTPECYAALCHHAAACAPAECCGLIVADRYIPCRNDAPGSEAFSLNPWDWKAAQDAGTIQAVCHSHPGASARPGAADARGCERSGLPWFIAGDDGLWRMDPEAYRAKLEGRVFRWGWSDCWNLVRDYFGQDMPDFPRADGESAAALYLANYERLGWVSIPRDAMEPGDVILMRLADTGPGHAAVYVGNSQILHHLPGRLSRKELLNGVYQSAIRLVLRRTE